MYRDNWRLKTARISPYDGTEPVVLLRLEDSTGKHTSSTISISLKSYSEYANKLPHLAFKSPQTITLPIALYLRTSVYNTSNKSLSFNT